MEAGFSLKDSTIGIIGLGLMGGSLAMSLKGKCSHIVGFDSHRLTLEFALSQNIIDQAETLAPASYPKGSGVVPRATQSKHIDLLILATPVSTIIDILQQWPALIPPPCIVTDIGSTKRDILNAMSALPKHLDPIGGHPICGKEKLGLENADANLYQNAPFVITPLVRTTARAKSAIKQIISVIGANYIEMTAEEHDRILASTSHLPYLLASALTNSTSREFKSLIGSGFRSTSRLADTPFHMMTGVLESNRDNILNAIASFDQSLAEIESALRNEDYLQLESVLKRSRSSYHALFEN